MEKLKTFVVLTIGDWLNKLWVFLYMGLQNQVCSGATQVLIHVTKASWNVTQQRVVRMDKLEHAYLAKELKFKI